MTFGKGKVFLKKFFISIFIFSIIVQQVLAHGREFKNMLVDLEIARAGEETYKVNLKTEVPYPDEIKIVKKSDYNYYILLAETYSLIKTTKSSGVIKSIKVDTYPYAEQNFENGFTKVTFNTTRPVDFVVSLSANRASKFPVMDLVRLARLDNLYKENNFDYLNPKYKVAAVTPPVKTQTAQPKEQTAQKQAQTAVKQPQKDVAVKKPVPSAKTVAQAAAKAPATKVAQQAPVKAPASKVATTAQKQAAPQKTADVQKQTQSVKVAQAQKPVTSPIATKKETTAQTPSTKAVTAQKDAQKQAKQTSLPEVKKQEQQKQTKTVTAQNAKNTEQPKQPQAQPQSTKVAQAPVKTVEVQSPKEIPHETNIDEDKVPENIELEPIEKIDEESVQHDFKTILLSFLIGNKISILTVLALLIALSAIYNMKKKSAKAQTPVLAKNEESAEVQTTESFENVLNEEVQTTDEITQELPISEESNLEKLEPEKEILETEENVAEEVVAQEEQEETVTQETETAETVQIEQEKETAQAEETASEAQTAQTQEISQEEIEEEIEQEIQNEIENNNVENIDVDQEAEDNLEVDEIKAEIEEAMDDALNPALDTAVNLPKEEEVIEIQKAENVSVHNLDIINRQTASGNYDDDLIELDDIKDEIAEIKNNLSSKEPEAQNKIQNNVPEIAHNEKPQTEQEKPQPEQIVASVEIPKQASRAPLKSVPELKRKPEQKATQELKPQFAQIKQAPQKPVQIRKAPSKKAPVARILCKTPIENDRGLYLADYAGNKALVGYVNNNVFVLYNFKKTKIMNNEIIFRLSEAKPKEDLYYVMVDNKKFLIKSEQYRLSLMQKIS